MTLVHDAVPVEQRTFGQTVRALRLAKGIGLREFARRLGISSPYLTQIEQDGGAPPPEERVIAMATELGEDPDELLALAGRVASDVQAYVRSAPREMATFLRTARDNGLSAADLARMVQQINGPMTAPHGGEE